MRGVLVLGALAPKHVAVARSVVLLAVRPQMVQMVTVKLPVAQISPQAQLHATWPSAILAWVKHVQGMAIVLAVQVIVCVMPATRDCDAPRQLRAMVFSARIMCAARACCWMAVHAAQVPPQA